MLSSFGYLFGVALPHLKTKNLALYPNPFELRHFDFLVPDTDSRVAFYKLNILSRKKNRGPSTKLN